MNKNEQFLKTLITMTIHRTISWMPADSYFAMPESTNPFLYAIIQRLDVFENAGKCYFCNHNSKFLYLFFYGDGIQLFLQKNSDSRVLQMKDVDRSYLYRLYNAICSSRKTDAEELDNIIDNFFD